MKVLVHSIVYDTDGQRVRGLKHNMVLTLPDDIDIDYDLENEIADTLWEETGWPVECFNYQILD